MKENKKQKPKRFKATVTQKTPDNSFILRLEAGRVIKATVPDNMPAAFIYEIGVNDIVTVEIHPEKNTGVIVEKH